jgi:phosphoglycerol transferase MdoB-like AlkP superfamily enzyme
MTLTVSGSDKAGKGTAIRQTALEIIPFVLFVVVILAKVSYFNYEPSSYIDNDWYPWYRLEAVLAVYGSLATLLIISSPVLLLRPATRFPVLCIESFVLSVLVLADVVHFRFYGDITSLVAAGGAWQIALVWRSVIALLKPSDAWFFVDVILGLALLPWYRRLVRSDAGLASRRPRTAIGVFAAGCFLAVIPVEIAGRHRPGFPLRLLPVLWREKNRCDQLPHLRGPADDLAHDQRKK